MIDNKKVANIVVIVLSVISVAETVLVSIFGAYPWYIMLLVEIAFICGVCLVRFSYEVACFRNVWYAIWYKRDSDGDSEPSEFAVGITKFAGYFLMFFATIVFLTSAIFM